MTKDNNLNKSYMIDIGAMPFSLSNCTRNQYRIIANTLQNVNAEKLQEAVDKVLPRFPMYMVKVCKRWNTLRQLNVVDMQVKVMEYENQFKPFDIYSGEPLFRVMYGKKMICVEMFHLLTDANGCVAFITSILNCYYQLIGMKTEDLNVIVRDSVCEDSEFEDGYFKYAKKAKASISNTKSLSAKAYKMPFGDLPNRQGKYTTYSFNAANLKAQAKGYNATVHEYLVTLLVVAYNRIKAEENSKKCIRIQMPINLRKRYNTESLRNFVATAQFDTFSTDKAVILQEFKEFLNIATSDNELKAFMWSAVTLMHGTLRFVPRFIGDFLMKTGDNILGEKANSTSFSNIGVVNNTLNKNGVVSYEFIQGTPLYVPFLVSAITFNNICNISFSSNTKNDKFQKYFIEELAKDNITPTMTTIRE